MARKNERSAEVLVAEVMEAGADDQVLKGKSFSITGHLAQPRARIVELISNAGGTFHKEPVWGTTYLITNADWSEGATIAPGTSRKFLKAKQNGTKLLSEAAFLAMLTSPSKP